MPSTNGHKKTALLYTRVSGDKQRDHGYSLSDQRRELEAWAAREGYDVLDLIEDGAWSGGDLARPGLDYVRDLVALGGVDAVVVLFRDRLARGVYAGLLAEEFAEYGCKLIALNAQLDNSPEGELHGGMLDIIAAWERKKIAERTRRGKLEKARQGKIIATMKPRYGFRYNEAKDGLVVYEPEMAVVEKIFRLAAEGFGPRAIQLRLYREGIPSPKGGKRWNRPVIKRMVLHDIYKPHTYEETVKLVSPEVAATLDPSKEYGIRWWNCLSQKIRQVAEPDGNGHRQYRKRVIATPRDREEWVAVPVPSYLPRSLVEQARASIVAHRPPERKHLARSWELRGLIRCECGASMGTHTNNSGRKLYYYYRCNRSGDYLRGGCIHKLVRAEAAEAAVWEFVSGVMKDPERIRIGMDTLIERRCNAMRCDPEREAKAWLDKLSEVDRKRSKYQDMAAEGLITFDELREKLAGLTETRETAERELQSLRGRQEEVEELERDRDALLASWSDAATEDLDALTSEQRNELYRRLRLEITPREEGYEVKGPFCTSEPLSFSRSLITAPTPPPTRSSSVGSSPR